MSKKFPDGPSSLGAQTWEKCVLFLKGSSFRYGSRCRFAHRNHANYDTDGVGRRVLICQDTVISIPTQWGNAELGVFQELNVRYRKDECLLTPSATPDSGPPRYGVLGSRWAYGPLGRAVMDNYIGHRDKGDAYNIGDSSPRLSEDSALCRIHGEARPIGRLTRIWAIDRDVADGDIPLLLCVGWFKEMVAPVDLGRNVVRSRKGRLPLRKCANEPMSIPCSLPPRFQL